MILYWFGHAPIHTLNDSYGDIVITGGSIIPCLFMLPNGDIVSYGSMGYWGGSNSNNDSGGGGSSGNTFYSYY